jgi:hypothetical protein
MVAVLRSKYVAGYDNVGHLVGHLNCGEDDFRGLRIFTIGHWLVCHIHGIGQVIVDARLPAVEFHDTRWCR